MGVIAAGLVAAVAIAAGGGQAASQSARSGVFTGYGFEACTAPSLAAIKAWSASPYRAVGIYLGGINRACADGNLSPTWVSSTLSLGWSLLPLYVGLQAPCASASLHRMSTVVATDANQGKAAADDAAAEATAFALPGDSPIYLDMEGYSSKNAACTRSVQSFVSGWDAELDALGYGSGVYGSAASTIRDVAALGSLPDDVWIANWNGQQSVFGDPYVSDALWTNHQRVHQYKGGHHETWGGVTINIDSDYVDGAVVGGTTAVTPPPPPPATPPAGTVASGDGKATATWLAGAFPSTTVVALTPTAQPNAAANAYGVQLTTVDSSSTQPVTTYASPVIVHLLLQANGLAPSWSPDGTNWKALPKLAAATLPAGVEAGYTLDADGTVEILTLEPAYFGLLPDTSPPGQPQSFAGHFSHAALTLSWSPPTTPSTIGQYQVLLDGTTVASLKPTARRVTVRAFHAKGQTVYRIRAVDAGGILGKPTAPAVVVPTPRPTTTPHVLPAWAWTLFTFQQTHAGARPAAAPRLLPRWYWPWAAWRLAPFTLKRI